MPLSTREQILENAKLTLLTLSNRYLAFSKDESKTHNDLKDIDKELSDFVQRLQEVENIQSTISEDELRSIIDESTSLSSDLNSKISIVNNMITMFENGSFKGDNGDNGSSFTYDDFTSEQLESLKVKGDKGESIIGDNGSSFTYDDFTSEQLESLKVKGDKGEEGTSIKGDKGDSFEYSDFTTEQLESLKVKGDKGEEGTSIKGDKGDSGDNGSSFTYDDFTSEQLESLKVKGDKGNKGDSLTFEDLTDSQKVLLGGSKPMLNEVKFGLFDINNLDNGWLVCDGTNDTPNMADKMPIGFSINKPLNTSGGSNETEPHTLSISEMPSHKHDIRFGTGVDYGLSGLYTTKYNQGATPTSYQGGNQSHKHNIDTPYHVFVFIIYKGI